ncbi:LCP family protein [Lentzea flaviverrucosa]|uniref:Transcriptional attenuator, LytR family n=1 Tax=Lentzea flaviverrucosa TaxID=200379 RepID=A0A1H9RUX9_9PSEU|nr:LCP family protein [Lentzea flaviverrucosa]RDI33134.1 LytR family transcriptional attenuator [Lentzea flaviverrucosa]SER75933.1 transcriptional attenuator, LytR family [Lentzea flaviverrucosa]
MNELIRQAINAEAEERVDSRTVLANLHKAKKRKPLGLIVGVATLTAAAAAAAVIIPTAIKKTEAAPPAAQATQEAQNVLLIGLDDYDHTDALMLARFRADGAAMIVSLPRDILVDGQKINSLFAQDPGKLTAAVEKTTGTKVDHYAAVKMSAFGQVSQLLGGVEVCLKAPSNDPITKVSFPAGRQVLQGDQALAFLRQRHGLENGDLDRARRQQMFLVGLASQITKDKALALARGVSGSISVDDGWDVLGFAQRFTGPVGISVTTLPVDAPVERETGFGYEVDPAKARSFVAKALDEGDHSGEGGCVR